MDEYVVKTGDNLWNITKEFYGTTSVPLCGRVAAMNGIEFPYLIYPGQKLVLPKDPAALLFPAPWPMRKEAQILDKCECCGTCRWHRNEKMSDSWVCVNDASNYVTDWTDYDFCCDEYEER